MSRSALRAFPRALALLLSLLLAVATATAVNATSADALAPVNTNHPYSDPVYYPVRVASTMDCFKNNPGCKTPHKDWMMDVVPVGQLHGGTSHAGVYSMGAGIVHYGNTHGAKCGKENSYGTWIWIDHGGGTLSRYGHLSKISVRNGQYVPAGLRIGTVGTTGKDRNCYNAYVNFSVQHRGLKTSHGVEFRTLRACSASTGAAQTWPNAISKHTRWNSMPQSTVIPASSGRCVPNATPATPAQPAKVKVASGKGSLRISWARPAAGYRVSSVQVEISEWHTSGKHWDLPRNSRWVSVPVSRTSVNVTGLTKKRSHRVRIAFRSAKGWSKNTGWTKRTTK